MSLLMRKKEERHVFWDYLYDFAINCVPVIIGIFLFYVLFGLFDKSLLSVVIYTVFVTLGMVGFYVYQTLTHYNSRTHFIMISALVLIATIFLFAEIYSLPANHDAFMVEYGYPVSLSYGDSLYFSTTTFTTLGYGDISPVGHFRYVAMTEALTGLILIGLFVYGMTRSRD